MVITHPLCLIILISDPRHEVVTVKNGVTTSPRLAFVRVDAQRTIKANILAGLDWFTENAGVYFLHVFFVCFVISHTDISV